MDGGGTDDYTVDNCQTNTSAQHTNNTAGAYTAKLTVEDGSGGNAQATVEITVTAQSGNEGNGSNNTNENEEGSNGIDNYSKAGGCSAATGVSLPLYLLIPAFLAFRRFIKR